MLSRPTARWGGDCATTTEFRERRGAIRISKASGNQIVQAPGFVTIVNEMIHESRIVPLDGRAHVNPAIRSYLGDSRGRHGRAEDH
jgi:hypothetical protein